MIFTGSKKARTTRDNVSMEITAQNRTAVFGSIVSFIAEFRRFDQRFWILACDLGGVVRKVRWRAFLTSKDMTLTLCQLSIAFILLGDKNL